jgi:hypothetical protein
MFYDDSVYPPALPLDDARLAGKDLGHETKANYVKKVPHHFGFLCVCVCMCAPSVTRACACGCVFCSMRVH